MSHLIRLILIRRFFIPLILIFATAGLIQPFAQPPGFYVEGRHLYDRCGERVILRGVNKMVVWTDKDGLPSFPEIAQTGANSVRIVWTTTDGTPQELDVAIQNAVDNKLIPMIELHDATGEWSGLSALVDWWVRPEVVQVIQKHEQYLLVNIGNEVGQQVSNQDFLTGYTDAVQRMRTAGIRTTLVIDAANWGQDINVLQATGPDLLEADPDDNLLFSVHMWWPTEYYGAEVAQMVRDEIQESVDMDLPLVIGEFAHKSAGCTPDIPYLTIIEEAENQDMGWLAWSWGPGNSDCAEMDMTTDGNFATLRDWGLEVAVSSPYSIQNTSVIPQSIQNGQCDGTPVNPIHPSRLVPDPSKHYNLKGQNLPQDAPERNKFHPEVQRQSRPASGD